MVMSADLEEVVMSVLFVCCNVCCDGCIVRVLQGLVVMSDCLCEVVMSVLFGGDEC